LCLQRRTEERLFSNFGFAKKCAELPVARVTLRRWYLVFLLALGSWARAADIGVEFSAVLTTPRETRVSLSNKATGQTQWVAVGKAFAGYVVTAYEPKSDVVVLTRDGAQYRLPLKNAKVQSGAAELPPETKAAILNNLRQLAAAADQFYLENGKAQANYDDLVGATKYVKVVEAKDGENYRAIEFAQGKPLTVTTASGVSVSYAP
jgi:hypothetical protein